MYKEYKGLDLTSIDQEIRQFWETEKVFEQSIEQRDPDNSFVFFEGPPSANGKPGIHHVMARTVKDLFCRYHTLKGKRVERKGGWDTHGLPVELQVEKELGITKEDIGTKITVEEYNTACRQTVLRYKDLWDDLTRKMGYWVDLDDPYITFENKYIETCWHLLSKLYNKGLLYKGFTVQPFSPAAGTGLSSHELNLPGCYQNVKDISAIAMFKVVKNAESEFLFDSNKEDVRIIAWTTTPWTLPSNVALTVGNKIKYVKVKTFSPYTGKKVSVILAKDRLHYYFPKENDALPFADYKLGDKKVPYNVDMANIEGSKLVGVRYEQLLPYVTSEELTKNGFRVIPGDFVTTEDGTGVVHTAPYFGNDDYRVSVANGIPHIGVPDDKGILQPLVDKQGRFVPEVTDFAGKYVKAEYYSKEEQDAEGFKSTDLLISLKLKEDNKAFNVQKYEHNYPHCWRTDKPILYYPLDSWFIKASEVKKRMSELNDSINWKPASTGTGRFGKWLENLQDWNLSRSRYWGTPLPIWRTEEGDEEICIGSIEHLRTEIEKANAALNMSQSVPADLHRPYIDDVVLVAPSGKRMTRELDLIDVWFDSGAMPYAQWHYPFENEDKFKNNFPADFIAEGVDQTRGWFYTLHAIATMAFDGVAYKNVVSNGLVLDKAGNKMSKSRGNAVDPFLTIGKYGADATRWYMISNAPPWDNLKFNEDGIDEVRRKFFGTLYNTYSFYALYANVDGFTVNELDLVPMEERPEIDRWIISKLNSLIAEVRAAMDDYEPTRACRAIESFTLDQLSNWYVRLCRRRFWKGALSTDKKAAYETLHQCLVTISQLMSPVSPFFADWLYQSMTDPIREQAIANNTPLRHASVHLTDLVEAETQYIDADLETRMEYAQRISSLVLSLRKKDKIRVRQPLQRIMIPVLDDAFQTQVDQVKSLIQSETNIKEIEYLTDDTSGVFKKAIKPNFKTLGRRLGKDMKAAAAAIGQFTQDDIAAIEKTGTTSIELNGTNYDLTLEDFTITAEDIPGWKVASDGKITLALDVTITEDLAHEGMARELVNRIQNIRKNSGLEVTDRISVTVGSRRTDGSRHALTEPSGSRHALTQAMVQFGDFIKSEVLADSLEFEEDLKTGESVDFIDDITLMIDVKPV